MEIYVPFFHENGERKFKNKEDENEI